MLSVGQSGRRPAAREPPRWPTRSACCADRRAACGWRAAPRPLRKLVSRLALDRLSPSEGGLAALQEMLALHDLGDSAAGRQPIAGLVGIERPAGDRLDAGPAVRQPTSAAPRSG
ncbi:MAG: type VI secretion system baseplate subunit TssF [Comamonadaceae bacterium]|nr:type VI secretion system baseplate subunit TssF [Comamonadaceae bacterium]